MYKLNLDDLLPYFEASKQYWDVWERVIVKGGQPYEHFLQEVDPNIKEQLKWSAVNSYARGLEGYNDYPTLYMRDVEYAVLVGNLYLLEILILARTAIPNLQFENTDLLILNYLTEFFKKSMNTSDAWFAKYLFEQVLDTADNDCDEYINVTRKLSQLGKDSNWYYDFRDQIVKLIYRAPRNEDMLSAAEALRDCLPEDMKGIVEEYIMDEY